MQLVGKDGDVSITESPALRLGRITRSCNICKCSHSDKMGSPDQIYWLRMDLVPQVFGADKTRPAQGSTTQKRPFNKKT